MSVACNKHYGEIHVYAAIDEMYIAVIIVIDFFIDQPYPRMVMGH